MDKKLLDILQNDEEKPIDDAQLLSYLKGALDNDVLHDVQQQELNDDMVADAMEGLRTIKDKARLEALTRDLNKQLQKKLKEKKQKHIETRKWKDQNWITLSIVSILLLIILCYLVFRFIK
jgi:uncharacterized membrane protein YukC